MLDVLWEQHQATPFPPECRGREVAGSDLMRLEASVAGCIETYLLARALDPARQRALVGCVAELERVVPTLEGAAHEYFRRLGAMAGVLLHHCQADAPEA